MGRESKRALVLILYLIAGTLDYADQVEREQAARTTLVAKH
jgi:hypothetical protein